jgi:hypothetical protein
MLLLFACTMVGFCCQTMNGFDGSLFGGLTANSKFLDFFGGSNDGVSLYGPDISIPQQIC